MTTTKCAHCGEELEHTRSKIPCLQWQHKTGFYGCNKSCPSHSATYAEPSGANQERKGNKS
jgi:hypothetical protein